jgi:hydrogenase/urease accessory protein HupE
MKKLLLAVAACALLCPVAQAHLVTTGLGPVYDGVGHFFLSPEDVLIAVALALFAGLRGPSAGRTVIVALPLGWLVGGIAGLYSGMTPVDGQVPSAVSLLLAGILIAADAALPGVWVSIVALVLAAAHGFYNGMAMREAGMSVALLQLGGIAVALFVLASLFAALVVALRRPVARIVVRVAGSWTAAIGLLLLGWAFRLKR